MSITWIIWIILVLVVFVWAKNGWGSYDSLVDDLTSILRALLDVDDDWTISVY